MTAINIGGAPSYIIPFDSLDLAYLGKYVSTPRAEKMPLWTKRRLDGESEYCQVEVVTRGKNNEDCYSEASDTYQCHICNVNVPKNCYQEHDKSDQHETFKKIYQKVLKRVSQQMDVNSMNSDEDIGNDCYYCEPCSKIIKIGNKNNHEATEYHAKSVKDLTIINEFYKIFNKNISNDVNEELLEEAKDPFNPNYNFDIDIESMDASSNNDSDDDFFEEEVVLPPVPGHSITETVNQSPKVEKKQSFEEYLKEMIKKYNLKVTPPVVDGEFITILTANGNKAKVSHENLHGYIEIKKNMYCQLCCMWISEDTRAHDVTEQHVRNIFRPINEKFARMVDSVTSHCIPCNLVVVTDSNLHVLDNNHKKTIKDTLTPKTDQTLCKDCNLYIDTHNFSVHLNSKKHLNVLMKQNSIQDSGNNDIFCNICKITIPKHQLKFHIGTKQHLTRKTNNSTVLSNTNNHTTVNNNASTEINNKHNGSLARGVKVTDTGFCKLCKVRVPLGGMQIHVDGKLHQTKLRLANKNDVEPNENKIEIDLQPSTSANTSSSCSTNTIIDRVVTTSTMSSLSISSNGTDHEDEKIDAYYDMTEFVDETRTRVRCKICAVNIVYVERNVIEHMEGKNHAANKKKIDEDNKIKLQGCNKLLCYADIEKTKLKCQICDVSFNDLDQNIIEHMEGRDHVFAEYDILKFNAMTRESSEFICECCSIRTTDYIEHINSRNHTLKFLEKYEIDRKEMRKYVYDDNINNTEARAHRVRYKNLLKHNGIFKLDDVNHYCGICQIKLGRISEIDHVLGERHGSQIEKVNTLSSFLERLELTDVITT